LFMLILSHPCFPVRTFCFILALFFVFFHLQLLIPPFPPRGWVAAFAASRMDVLICFYSLLISCSFYLMTYYADIARTV
jgi:hypothetical protein